MARLNLLLPALACAFNLHAQEADRAIRKGNAAYESGDLKEAVNAYSGAEKDERAVFNLGNALYRQDSTKLALQNFENAASMAKGAPAQARAYHNLGNSWMRQGNFQEAVNAYKEALKRVPDDDDTRYNLAYAQKKLAQQQQQQKQDKNQGQDKDKDQKDKQKQEQQKKDGQQKDEQKKDEQQKKEEQKKQEQQRQDRIDPQDAQRMLDAAQQQEKEVQEKVLHKTQPKPATPTDKDW